MSYLKPSACLLAACFLVGCQTATNTSSPMASPTVSASATPTIETSTPPAEEIAPEEAIPSPSSYPVLELSATEALEAPTFTEGTPVYKHGKLTVSGTDLLDAQNEIYQLRGVSTHGVQWFSNYLNPTIFTSLRDDFHMNGIRLALYADYSSGYLENQEEYTAILEQAISDATAAGLYVVIDWHILEDADPLVHEADAITFFNYFSTKYQNYPNIIYELCNEPNGNQVTWSDHIKPYSEKLIATIRANAPDSIIIVGTPHWCQSPLSVADDPLETTNVLFALHFYSASHGTILRSQLESAITEKGLPMIISEFGTCEASGSGTVNVEQTEKWMNTLDTLHISWFNWSLCDKDEASALLVPNAPSDVPITDESLTESGKLIKKILLSYPEDTQ